MKKTLSFLLFIILGTQLSAQFILTPNGFTTHDNKDYIVYNFENKTQTELYNAALMSIGRTFVSPKDVISKVENKQINLVAYIPKGVSRTNYHKFDLTFNVVFEFKDNKIKINSPNIISIIYQMKYLQQMYVKKEINLLAYFDGNEWTIYNSKDVVKLDMAKETLEATVNNLIENLINNIKQNSTNDNW